MCKFCEKIYENQDELETALYYAERADRENNKYDHENHVVAGICKNGDTLEIHITCDDDFYDPFINDIKYCPCCGRKLV